MCPLDRGVWSLTVDSSDGAIITSLRTGEREWLVQGPPRGAGPDPSRYSSSPPRGWDEMCPSIEQCDCGWSACTDHGEAWRFPWTDRGDGSLEFKSSHGYQLRRTVQVDEADLLIEYELLAGLAPLDAIWSAHPLFQAPPGTWLSIGDYAGPVIDKFSPQSESIDWLQAAKCIDEIPVSGSKKYILPRNAGVDFARVVHSDGTFLELRWDTNVVPYLGLYLENCRHSLQPAVAIEPMTGWYDSLLRAKETGSLSCIEPGCSLAWWLRVSTGVLW